MPRPFSLARLRRNPGFPRLVGVPVEMFDRMVDQLREPWAEVQRGKRKSGRPWEVGGLEEHLFVMLLYYRCYTTQEFVGCLFDVDKSVVCRTIKRIEAIARPLFGLRPEPRITEAEALAIIVDCTEQPIHRPKDNDTQKLHYSGKKKRHTLKTEYLVTEEGRIVAGSPPHPGSRHDLAIRRKGPKLPNEVRLYGDSAYQGYGREHPNIDHPYKKPRGGELDEQEKEYNKGLSRFRVRVEHKIGQVKRFRIVSDRFRNPRGTHHTKTSIVGGIVNMVSGFDPF